MLLTAFIASHRSKRKTRESFQLHRDILQDQYLQLALKLGTILQLAVALDRSKTQILKPLQLSYNQQRSVLTIIVPNFIEQQLEWHEVRAMYKDFAKILGVELRLSIHQ
jgi:exopolyphosphatase/guanosine-5'-triphosphate,3'-diphosphate pyrophosphatase